MKTLIFILAVLTISMVASADTTISTPVTCLRQGSTQFENHLLSITISYPVTKIGLEDNVSAFVINGHWAANAGQREANGVGDGFDTSKLVMGRLRFIIKKYSTTDSKDMVCQGKELSMKLDEYDQKYQAVKELAEKVEEAQQN